MNKHCRQTQASSAISDHARQRRAAAMPPRASGVAASPTRVRRSTTKTGRRQEEDRWLLQQRYQLEPRPIGRGAYGTVYLADDALSEDSARVAVKSLSKEETPGSSAEQQRSKACQEVRIQRALRHCPFACQVLGVDEDDDSLYIIMEHVNGPSLQTVLDMRGKLTEREAALAIHDILQVRPTPLNAFPSCPLDGPTCHCFAYPCLCPTLRSSPAATARESATLT